MRGNMPQYLRHHSGKNCSKWKLFTQKYGNCWPGYGTSLTPSWCCQPRRTYTSSYSLQRLCASRVCAKYEGQKNIARTGLTATAIFPAASTTPPNSSGCLLRMSKAMRSYLHAFRCLDSPSPSSFNVILPNRDVYMEWHALESRLRCAFVAPM